MEERRPIIILSGPVGAGKTTIAKEMVKISPVPLVYIEGDLFWKFFAKFSKTQSRKSHFKLIMRSMIAAALPYTTSDYTVLVDFSVPPWFLPTAQTITKMREVPLQYIVVCPDKNICAKRAAERTEGKIEDYSIYDDFYADFAEAGNYIVKNDDIDPKIIAKQLWEGINAGKFTVG